MTFSITARIAVREDDQYAVELRRLVHKGERSSIALKRLLARYSQIMHATPPAPFGIVRDLHEVMISGRMDLLGGIDYPPKERVVEAIENSTIPSGQREAAIQYITKATYAQYAKLIEGVELMYNNV